MRSRNRILGSLALLATLLVTGHAAVAADVVVMPFSCDVVDGKPMLTPSDETAHRIFGQREHKKVKTCSTVDPKRCRQWATYKFDMDCGGKRVPWMQVFANATEHTKRRAWESNGRLRVQDTRQRSKRIDDMCARNLGPSLEWNSVSEACDEVSPLNAPIATVMPAGFAPMVGLDAAFLSEDALTPPSQRAALAREGAQASKFASEPARSPPEPVKPALDQAKANTAQIARESAKPAAIEREPARPPAAPEKTASQAAPIKATPPPRVAEAPASPPAAERPAALTPAAPEAKPEISVLNKPAPTPAEPVTSPAEAAPESNLAASNATATRLAATADETAEKLRSETSTGTREEALTMAQDTAPQPSATAGAPVETSSVANNVATAAQAYRLAVPPVADAVLDVDLQSAAPRLTATGSDSGSTLAFAIGGFVVAALTMATLVINWMVNAQPTPAAGPRNEGMATSVYEPTFDRAPPRQNLPTVAPAPLTVPAHFGHVNNLGDRMPSSMPEALAVLGMGVASERNLTSLKKIIDGLRMNWHPDHASDEADRRTRELRMKQINAAWEILGEKGAA